MECQNSSQTCQWTREAASAAGVFLGSWIEDADGILPRCAFAPARSGYGNATGLLEGSSWLAALTFIPNRARRRSSLTRGSATHFGLRQNGWGQEHRKGIGGTADGAP